MKAGLTLIEIMIIMAIVGLMAAIVIPAFLKVQNMGPTQAFPLKDYRVAYLFETNGLKVYRFQDPDNWNTVYFVDGRGKTYRDNDNANDNVETVGR